MSGNGYVIDNWGLLVALLMVAVAALVSELMCISIGKTLMWSAIRALVQLCVMGVIIGYVIRSNNPWLVFGVIAVMLVAAVQITLSRAKGIPKGLAGPVLLSLVITMLLMISLVTELVVRPHPWYAPQLVVPLTGMLLGNTVSALAVGLSRFYESMNERRDEVDTLLALGATPWEAARPSIVSSIRLGLLPTTASLASCGIVTIPGMMAGQVIAGGDPLNAAKYQFVVFSRHRRAHPRGRRAHHDDDLSDLLHRQGPVQAARGSLRRRARRSATCIAAEPAELIRLSGNCVL